MDVKHLIPQVADKRDRPHWAVMTVVTCGVEFSEKQLQNQNREMKGNLTKGTSSLFHLSKVIKTQLNFPVPLASVSGILGDIFRHSNTEIYLKHLCPYRVCFGLKAGDKL